MASTAHFQPLAEPASNQPVPDDARQIADAVVERWSQGQWQASAWWLERRHPEHWSLLAKDIRELLRTVAEQQEQIDQLVAARVQASQQLPGGYRGGDSH